MHAYIRPLAAGDEKTAISWHHLRSYSQARQPACGNTESRARSSTHDHSSTHMPQNLLHALHDARKKQVSSFEAKRFHFKISVCVAPLHHGCEDRSLHALLDSSASAAPQPSLRPCVPLAVCCAPAPRRAHVEHGARRPGAPAGATRGGECMLGPS
jgi:hypothetical protein